MSVSRKIISSSHEIKGKEHCYYAEWEISDYENKVLTVMENIDGNNACLTLRGSLRNETAMLFQDELTALATVDVDVKLDCSELISMSNACKIALIRIQQMMDKNRRGTLTLTKLSDTVRKDLEAQGVDGCLSIK